MTGLGRSSSHIIDKYLVYYLQWILIYRKLTDFVPFLEFMCYYNQTVT